MNHNTNVVQQACIMPVCNVSNCFKRSTSSPMKLKHFGLPKEKILREKWLEACHILGKDIKLEHVRICEKHFTKECFEEQWTKSRDKSKPSRMIVRLKKGAIPTKNLILKRKSQDKRQKRTVGKSSMPSYAELLNYTGEKEKCTVGTVGTSDISTEAQGGGEGTSTSCTPVIITRVVDNTEGTSSLSHQSEMEKDLKVAALEEQIKKLAAENAKLSTSLQEQSLLLEHIQKEKKNEANQMALDLMSKVFTPGQVKHLMSPGKSRIQWCGEDITSAIALRSLSPKAYRYLRNVKHMPLPCESTLRNWCSGFNIQPGLLFTPWY